MPIARMTELNLFRKRVLIRSDLNVPIKEGQITSYSRILAALPTIETALKKGAYVMISSHMGRPTEGEYNEEFSLLPVVNYLKEQLGEHYVSLVKNYLNGINLSAGKVMVLENVRFNKGEIDNDITLSKKYAALCDIFVMDAFGSAHRSQASTHGISKFAEVACAGPLLLAELDALGSAMKNPSRPMIAVIGGSKISSKFNILNSLVNIADTVIIGGGIANTFIAIDNSVGNSLYEPTFLNQAKKLRDTFSIPVPVDVRVSTPYLKKNESIVKRVSEIQINEEILDIGDKTALSMATILKSAQTILWNGPVGVFELPHFQQGTKIIAQAIADSNAFSIAGGGDTLAAIDLFDIKEKISYISTGGGSFLEFIEGKDLPAVTILKSRTYYGYNKQQTSLSSN
ncbi:phosphoglycerate kinase [Candidatus Erwinia haradaeae]|uniref:Phosphoglycerate kinase n=1 Tax=Candidatus Erwinia haradaeae TaxID=1922217 RepID=A0A803FTI8_9GAMM|nr:phosphoglycerate kinase [Candidatus Erwinia haradaeae]VFP88033.1 Phosphoglycerate kinase [Candidatus Erwinia haradaeae]